MTDTGPIHRLRQEIGESPAAHRHAWKRRLKGLERRARQGRPFDRGLERLSADIARERRRLEARQSVAMQFDYDPALPIVEHRAALTRALEQHQVIVVCGETGSGKSTQLPKLCLELGRGREGLIAHTQPRRIAARSLATRIAEETRTPLGAGIGYRVRFTDQVSDQTRLKLLTDGMLLAETQADPDLAAYDTVIIDEAHERSLNIDFLLGYLRRLVAQRPDLKLIITSATIDPERFSRHFDDAPIVRVSGRTYPVETRYRPLVNEDEDERDRTLYQGVLDAVDELAGEGRGDILVFLPGEREIRDAAERLRKHHPPHTEILPLFGRLSTQDQQRVFAPHAGRRVVLATNVAETSLTVPGIRYVVDSGLVRLSRYSFRTKVQRLPVEPVSQASADQRAGRCGREGPGICIRLFGEEDFRSRPAYTDPEILRTNLASVILQMKFLRLGEIESFPFMERPDPRYVRDGLNLLKELGALDRRGELSPMGQRLARLPVDPRLARMLIAGNDHGCLAETLVVSSALAVQDPRERPMQARDAADQAHEEWRDERSDFISLLRLWKGFQSQRHLLSGSKLRSWCRNRFLSYLRLREWRDVHTQLRETVKGMGFRENTEPADSRALHTALLTGLLSNIALRDTDTEYTGARNLRLRIFPGSGLARRRPKWIVAAELVETRRVFARTVAEVRPEWVESVAGHLVSRGCHEPFFDPTPGRVMAFETVQLFGLPLVSRRKVNLAPIDPATSREVFIREALVADQLASRAACLQHNRQVIADVEALEAKARRRDVLVDDSRLFDFYAERLPDSVVDGPSFERWVRDADNDTALRIGSELLKGHEAGSVSADAYPDRLAVASVSLPLEYHFEPGDPRDGVSVVVPIAALNALDPEPFEWLVPGLLESKVVTLIKALPKSLRRHFVPAPDFAQAVLERAPHGQGSLAEAVRRELAGMTGVTIPQEAWDEVAFPEHLRMGFRVVDAAGETLQFSRELHALQQQLGERASASFSGPESEGFERSGLTRWSVGTLPETRTVRQGGVTLHAYPALVDEGRSVALRLIESADAAARSHRAGVRRLLALALAQQTRYIRRQLPGLDRLILRYRTVDGAEQLREELVAASLERVFFGDGVPRTEEAFRATLERGRERLVPEAERLAALVAEVLERYEEVRRRLEAANSPAWLKAVLDMRSQLDAMIHPGFILATPAERLTQLPRYLRAMSRRLDRLERDPARDDPLRERVAPWWQRYLERGERARRRGRTVSELEAFRWAIEEYRVSLFAQDLGTEGKVSEKRLAELWPE